MKKQKKSASLLHGSENFYRTLFEQASYGQIINDAITKKTIDANKAAADIYECEITDLLNDSPIDFNDESSLSGQCWQTAIETGEAQTFRESFTSASGNVKVLEIILAPIISLSGDIENFQLHLNDVTEQKHLEAMLNKSNEQLYRLVGALPHRAAVISEDGRIRQVLKKIAEPNSERYQPSGNLTDKLLQDIYPPEFATYCMQQISETLASETVRIIEYDLHQEDEIVHFEGRLTPYTDHEMGEKQVLWITRDITERKAAELALRESEERYRIISSISSDGAYSLRYDEDKLVLEWVIGGMLQSLGYSHDDFLKNLDGPQYHPDDLPKAIEMKNRLEKGEVVEGEFRVFDKSGNLRWLYIKRFPEWDDTKTKIVRYYGINREITERKQAEIALQESEEWHRNISDLLSDIAFSQVYDEEQDRFVSERLTGLSHTGYTPEELRQTDPKLRYHPDDYEYAMELVEATRKGESTIGEYRMLTKDNQVIWVRAKRKPQWDENGQRVIRYYGVAEDITERKLAEEALRQSEERYRIISELISDNAYSHHYVEGKGWQTEWNVGGTAKQLGYTKDEWISSYQTRMKDIIHPDDFEQILADADAARRGIPSEGEYRMFTKQGEIVWTYIKRYPIWDKQEERVIRYYGVTQNITERKFAEDALRESEANLREAQKIAKLGNFSFDLHTQAVIWSDTVYKIFEQPLGADITMDLYQALLEPDDFADVMLAVNETIQTGEPYEIEHAINFEDGRQKYVYAIGRPIKDENEQVVKIFGIIQDITERKILEKELESSKEHYRIVSELVTNHAFSTYYDNQTDSWKSEWKIGSTARSLGYTEESFSMAHALHPDDRERALADRDATRSGIPTDGEYRFITKDGDINWIHIKRHPIWDADKKNVIRLYAITQNVTERKLAELALRESEERYRALFEQSRDAILIEGAQGVYIDCNQAAADMSGYSIDEIIGSNWRKLILPAEIEQVEQDMQANPTELHPVYERTVLHKNGETFTVEISLAPIHDSNGELLYTQAVIRDITERKKYTQRLEEERLLLRTVIDHIPYTIYVKDRDSRFKIINKALIDFYAQRGLSSDQILGRTDFETFTFLNSDPSYAQLFFDTEQELMDTGKSQIDFENVYNDIYSGKRHYWLETKVPIRDSSGIITGLVGINRNETERRTIEQRLINSEKTLRAFANALPDRAVIFNTEGRYIEVLNSSITGEHNTGQLISEVFTDEFAQFALRKIKQTLESQQIQIIDYTYPRDDTLIYLEARLVPYHHPKTNRDCVIWITRDVTEQKEAEETIRKALVEKETLLKEVHHRVKNNLQVVSSLLHMQSMKVQDANMKYLFIDSEARVQSMALIHEKLYQTENLAQIDFKDYLETLLNNIVRLQSPDMNVTLDTTDVDLVYLPLNTAIPCGLIINELVSNAFKHAFPEKTGHIQIRFKRENDNIILTVQDNGIGLPEDYEQIKSNSLGLRLLTMLVAQIDGTINLTEYDGTRCVIKFRG